MGKIIAVVSGKGGTGKTSFTANVGLALAALGKNTLCLDCDITLRNLDLALGLTDKALMDFSRRHRRPLLPVRRRGRPPQVSRAASADRSPVPRGTAGRDR